MLWFVLALSLPVVFAAGVVFWTGLGHLGFARYQRNDGERGASVGVGVGGWLRLYSRTIVGAFRVAWWNLRALGRDGLRVPAGAAADSSPVLCVHGFHMNGSCMWGIRRHLEHRGRPTGSLYLGLPYRDPGVYAAKLKRAIDELGACSSQPVDVVAHSMGGLVVRHALAASPELGRRIGRIVTLGTPHAGTAFLRRGTRGPVVKMMGRDSPYLRELPGFAESVPETVVTTLAAQLDLIVFPADTAHLPGTRQATVPAVGHLGLLTEPASHQAIVDALGCPRIPRSRAT